jgi:putative phosphoesterase
MRIAVISDTHIPDRAEDIPPEVLKELRKADLVIHAGDLVELNVLDKLKAACKEVVAVQGNMDPYEVKSKLPEKTIIKVGAFRIGVMHGYGPADGLLTLLADSFKEDKVDVIIFGHSHTPLARKIDKIIYFNPGSLTDKMFSPFNAYGIIEVSDKIETKIIRL